MAWSGHLLAEKGTAAMEAGMPDGWQSMNNVVGPATHVAAYAARRQGVKGMCRSRGCYRRLEIDPVYMCERGFGVIQMSTLRRSYQCQRLDGCMIDFTDAPPERPLTLSLFLKRPNVRLRLRCTSDKCAFFRLLTIEQMVASLQRRKLGGSGAEVEKIGPMMKASCPSCQTACWKAEVLWVRTETVGWRQKGEAVFDDMVAQAGAK